MEAIPSTPSSYTSLKGSYRWGRTRPQIRHILVPIDFSPASKNAFHYAVQMAIHVEAKLTVMHAYTPAVMEPHMAPYMQQALISDQESLALSFFAELEQELSEATRREITLTYQLSMGNAVEEILGMAKQLKVDRIFIGKEGSKGARNHIFGSTTSGVIQRSPCPVMVIPSHQRFNIPQHIVYATDYEAEDLHALDQLLDFASNFGAHIHCVHVNSQKDRAYAYKREILCKAYEDDFNRKLLHFITLNDTDIVRALGDYIAEHRVDMLVMLTHKRSVLGQLFHKSLTKRMSFHARVPLLAIQQEA